ncbi:MAG: hypothetical protein GY875_08875 [Gammaproteobacteria bacterium]|nr:hypothetical protein [Gammaproteobacteria bacterium]
MAIFEIAIWIYLGIGFIIFVIEFRKFDDFRKWIVLPIPLLFVTWLWPWVLLVNRVDLTRKQSN